MHNLFLGLVHFHFRTALGIDLDNASVEHEAGPINQVKLEKARKIYKAGATVKSLSSFNIPILKTLCKEYLIEIPSPIGGRRQVKKIQIINALLENTDDDTSMLEPRAIFTTDILGAKLLDDIVPTMENGSDADSDAEFLFLDTTPLTRSEIQQIQDHIQKTDRPVWNVSPPPNLGEASHGKLKADQWRSCIEFDLPVSLAQLWTEGEQDERKLALLQCTIHAAKYTEYMHSYLKSMLQLFPGLKLRPNHHNALHIGEFLLRFGPMHGWWMYPFERFIGILQNIRTNNKMGELEKTMFETFCAASNTRAFLMREDCPIVLQECADILD
ncbi:hypothetical protein BD410DRAFT_696923, partial [Rickenella mellea]